MKIAIVIDTLPRYSVGGSEMCAAAIAAELAKRHRRCRKNRITSMRIRWGLP